MGGSRLQKQEGGYHKNRKIKGTAAQMHLKKLEQWTDAAVNQLTLRGRVALVDVTMILQSNIPLNLKPFAQWRFLYGRDRRVRFVVE